MGALKAAIKTIKAGTCRRSRQSLPPREGVLLGACVGARTNMHKEHVGTRGPDSGASGHSECLGRASAQRGEKNAARASDKQPRQRQRLQTELSTGGQLFRGFLSRDVPLPPAPSAAPERSVYSEQPDKINHMTIRTGQGQKDRPLPELQGRVQHAALSYSWLGRLGFHQGHPLSGLGGRPQAERAHCFTLGWGTGHLSVHPPLAQSDGLLAQAALG
ncbi:hypothetical protein AOLI_G00027190 [Acnodon oligacanthus]